MEGKREFFPEVVAGGKREGRGKLKFQTCRDRKIKGWEEREQGENSGRGKCAGDDSWESQTAQERFRNIFIPGFHQTNTLLAFTISCWFVPRKAHPTSIFRNDSSGFGYNHWIFRNPSGIKSRFPRWELNLTGFCSLSTPPSPGSQPH